MRKIHLISSILLCICLKLYSQNITPPVYEYGGYRSINLFVSKNFNSVMISEEVIRNSEKLNRVLISFIITAEGRVDSIIVHENTNNKLAEEVQRTLKLSNNHWTPAKFNDTNVVSPRIFWPIYFYCIDCTTVSEKIGGINKDYFNNYSYSNLSEWTNASLVYKDMLFWVTPSSYKNN